MKRKLFTPLSMGAMALALVMVACGKAPQLTRDNVDDVLAHMTLDEKINIVVGAGNETFTGYGNTKKLVPGAAGTTSPIPRLGIHREGASLAGGLDLLALLGGAGG